MNARFLAIVVMGGTLGAAGCSEPAWQPSGTDTFSQIEEPLLAADLWAADDQVAPPPEDRAAAAAAATTPEAVLNAELGAPVMHFINFSDGTTTLTKTSVDNAPKNQSFICGSAPSAYPKFAGNDATKRKFVSDLAGMMADFNIILTTTRPSSGSYSMEMVGPEPTGTGCPQGGAGVGPMDCGNQNKVNISFTFLGGVVTTAQESGHAFGLEHIDEACDVMGAGYTSKQCPSGKWGYIDGVAPVIKGNGPCGEATENTYQRMLTNVGKWMGGPKPDPWTGAVANCTDTAPTIAFDQPMDGASVPNNFTVKVSATDNCGTTKAHISVPAQGLTADANGSGPYTWNLTSIADGDAVVITVDVYDSKNQMASKSITVKVGAGGAGNSGGGGSSGSGGNGSGGNGGSAGNGSGGSAGNGGSAGSGSGGSAGNGASNPSGSGCQAAPGTQSTGFALFFGALALGGLLRRMRRAPALLALVASAAFTASGCEPAWQPSGTAELNAIDDVDVAFPMGDEVEAPAPKGDNQIVYEAITGAPFVHFLNFSDGTTNLVQGSDDDATKNQSYICGATPYPKFAGTDSEKRLHTATYAAMVKDFNLILVTKRPTSGVYSMTMIGPEGNGCSPGPGLGIAVKDCGDRNKASVSFVFGSSAKIGGGATVTAQEAAHGWGLEHADVACDVMGAGYSSKTCASGKWGYIDATGPILASSSKGCGPSTQNAYQKMLSTLGMWGGGDKPDPYEGVGGPPAGGTGGSGGGGAGGGGTGGGSGAGGGSGGGSGAGGGGGGGGSGGDNGTGGSGGGGAGGDNGGTGGNNGGSGGSGGSGNNSVGGTGCSFATGSGRGAAPVASLLFLAILIGLRTKKGSRP